MRRWQGTEQSDEPGEALPLLSVNRTSAVLLMPPSARSGYSYVQIALNGVDFEGEVPYEYVHDPTVLSVVPSGGPLAGGTVVTVRGHGFRGLEHEDAYVEQWAHAASSRSQYSHSMGAAARAAGPPDATACGDDVLDPQSWMPRVSTDVPDWLQLEFARPVRVWRWRIFMSARPHAVTDVELVDTLGRRVRVNVNASTHARTFEAHPCRCGRANAHRSGCSAIVEGYLPWREQPLAVGLRISTLSDGWEGIDAVQLAGYAETQQCKLGAQFSSLLLQLNDTVVCPSPAHGATRLVVHGTSARGGTRHATGYFYPLYLLPPREPHHAHAFAEFPGVTFYMPDAEAHHAEASVEPGQLASLVEYMPGATRAGLARLSGDERGELQGVSNATDTCEWARDGLCDVPPFCEAHTDCTDCGLCSRYRPAHSKPRGLPPVRIASQGSRLRCALQGRLHRPRANLAQRPRRPPSGACQAGVCGRRRRRRHARA